MTSLPRPRSLAAVSVAALLAAAAVSGCSHGTSATATTSTGSPSPSPTSASPTPSPSPTLSAQQAASGAAYNAYAGMLRDIDAVVEGSRDHYDPRLRRHATSTGFTLASETVDWYINNGWGIHGHPRIVNWRVTRYEPAAKPYAITATACVDSSSARIYDRKTRKVAPPLAGHERVPSLVQVQIDHGTWRVVYTKSHPEKTC